MKDSGILIIEDEYLIAMNIQYTLEDMGHSVMGIALDAEEAIGMLKSQMPNLVLMDIVLRGSIDGIELATDFINRYGLPVVFLSGNLEGENMRRIEKLRHSGCLAKPCDDNTLDYTIRYALSESRKNEEKGFN